MNLKSSLARIFAQNGFDVIGSGCLLADDHILTCAHVVNSALGRDRNHPNQPHDPIQLDFPASQSTAKFHATISYWGNPAELTRDIAVLKLTTPSPPDTLGGKYAEVVAGQIKVIGFPKGFSPTGQIAEGKIAGSLPTGLLQINHSRDEGYFVEEGYSGTPVWSVEHACLIGMIVAADKRQNMGVSFMIPTDLLAKNWPLLETAPVMTTIERHVFISYATVDGSEFANDLYAYLQHHKINIWMDKHSLPPGSEWDEEIINAGVEAAQAVVVVLTPGSALSKEVKVEWRAAIEKFYVPVIPLLAKPCDIHPVLEQLNYINCTMQRAIGFDQLRHRLETLPTSHLAKLTQELEKWQAIKPDADQLGRWESKIKRLKAAIIRWGGQIPEPPPQPIIAVITQPDSSKLQQFAQSLTLAGIPTPTWCIIPAGRVTLGDNTLPNTPEHELDLPDFLIAETLITNEQYQVFARMENYPVPYDEEDWLDPEYCWEPATHSHPIGRENHPVAFVSAKDAEAYCAWLGKLLQLPIGWRVMLPSEAEWEKAARGNTKYPYPWGKWVPDKEYCNFDGFYGGTTPVGFFPDAISQYGLFDMAGNVWEWTRSAFRPYPYNPHDGRENSNLNEKRVLRGGSWHADESPNTLKSAFRLAEDPVPDYVHDNIGFRVVIRPE